jgi:signal transduction histidine kinase
MRPYPERVAEIEHDSTIPENVKQQRIALREAFAGSLAVPLFAQDQVFGGLVFYYVEPQQFGEEQVQLAMTFAEQMALAIENARLRQDEQQRRQEAERRRQVAEGLRDTLSKINSSRSLDEVLDFVVMQADELSASKFVALYVQPDEQGPFEVRALRGAFPEAMRGLTLRPNEGVVGRVVAERRVIAIPDIDQIAYASSVQEIDENHPVFIGLANRDVLQEAISAFKAVLAIPLLTQNGIYGALAFYFPTRHEFQPDEVQLASAFADQAALAIENALLRGQATEMAKLAERSRLARDLHDAVTQTLFSASLIADVLPVLWQRNPDTGRQKLDELRMLTRGALSEMRTLLLELRPDTLTDVELGDLYRHLANAFSGRTRVPVAFTQEGQAPLPPEVKEAFYRVAQEALNNSAKHANASSVQLQLNAQPDWAEVAICDNGVGFDVAELMAENLGLKIMHERAEAIGARLSIDSQPGAGTRIELVWRLEDEA